MFSALLIAKCVFILIFPRCMLAASTHDLEDFTGRDDKLTIQKLAMELVIDAKLYHRQIMVIREQHNMFLSYEIGLVIGQIRETYKRMMEVYHEAITKKKNRFGILPPSVADYKSLHFLVYMETIRSLEMDIDKLVHVLETIPTKMIMERNAVPGMEAMMQGMPEGPERDKMTGMMPPGGGPPGGVPPGGGPPGGGPPGGGPPGGGRMRSEDQDLKFLGSTTHPLTAEEVKQAYRDQYYSERREDNWTLDDYYGFSG